MTAQAMRDEQGPPQSSRATRRWSALNPLRRLIQWTVLISGPTLVTACADADPPGALP